MICKFYVDIDIGHDAILEQHVKVDCKSEEEGITKIKESLKDYSILKIVSKKLPEEANK